MAEPDATKTVTENKNHAYRRRLREKDLKPAPAAQRRVWIRRATFDLIGLPPTPDEINAFLGDESPHSHARVIDRLLASRRYGERMAQHWLDVVRYADTAGYSNDWERPSAWRYRDYVIRSFNDDKPFDRFVVEQIAGDELDPKNTEMRIAVGFLRMGPWEQTGMSVAAVTRQLFLDDVTHSVGVTFLAQGLRCCRCHASGRKRSSRAPDFCASAMEPRPSTPRRCTPRATTSSRRSRRASGVGRAICSETTTR